MKSSIMRGLTATAYFSLAAGATAFALDPRAESGLRKLDPEVRLEQVCDVEAMVRIRQTGKFLPDRAKSDVISHPEHIGDLLKAPGAAFRSKGEWYSFSFECKGTPDHLRVTMFSFEFGSLIPASKWADLGLWR